MRRLDTLGVFFYAAVTHTGARRHR